MNEPIFECANIPVAVAAKALKVDAQTVRLLLQSGAVDWGIAYRRKNKSKQFSYLIYPKLFYETTGYIYQPDKGGMAE
ncbi:MAG: hypothetical protein NC094_01360 [Bacteroidales bacterium]|nr:hypothetical protein [Lachnoclostridium sp.]MCM1384498.1 hypothetical protein [Lachnoclostridium sp.]MCM1464042.1 hypothetical protein [Bacteroidales bacterium]